MWGPVQGQVLGQERVLVLVQVLELGQGQELGQELGQVPVPVPVRVRVPAREQELAWASPAWQRKVAAWPCVVAQCSDSRAWLYGHMRV